MKRYQSKEGPYPVRLVYESSEIDDICEGALREARFLPKEPAEINIDGFLEKFFGVHVLYEDLGEGILGSTVFASTGRVTGILISSRIEEDGSEVGERRARSTLAHEGGHGLLHPQLFMEDTQTGDFFGRPQPKGKTPERFLCRKSDIGAAGGTPYDGRWWEWQANRAIGGLLLPRKLVTTVAAEFTTEGKFGPILEETKRPILERKVAEIFNVNPAVARIRIAEMLPPPGTQKRF